MLLRIYATSSGCAQSPATNAAHLYFSLRDPNGKKLEITRESIGESPLQE
jgi:hypothetical protein